MGRCTQRVKATSFISGFSTVALCSSRLTVQTEKKLHWRPYKARRILSKSSLEKEERMAQPVPTKAFLQLRPKISQGVILAMNHRGWLQGQLGEVLSVKT